MRCSSIILLYNIYSVITKVIRASMNFSFEKIINNGEDTKKTSSWRVANKVCNKLIVMKKLKFISNKYIYTLLK